VSGHTFSLPAIEAVLERLLDATLDERRAMPGMLPQRADILVGGGLILTQCLRLLAADAALLESNDLLLGYLMMRRRNSRTPE
jgi:exopolyphosphatase/guanosine-5'-triphosphate,3'-diphosphate pyrophosphatase